MNTLKETRQFRAKLNSVLPQDDAQAIAVTELFSPWQSDTAYTTGDRRRHGDNLYRCVQAHTSQDGWSPDAVPALWTLISIDEWPEWVRPTGAHNAYQTGDKVTFEGKRYISKINGNTWSPAEYPAGWEAAV